MALTTIYQLKTFVDLYTAVREELKIQSTDTTALNRIQRDINISYLDEVVPFSQWKWLRGSFDTTIYAYITAGTATATLNSQTVTLTVPIGASKQGWLFSVVGYSEVYRIAQHASNTGTVILEAPFTGSTNSAYQYQIWTDEIYLPSFIRETFEVRHDFNDQVLTNCGLQEFRTYVTSLPKAQGRPYFYTTNTYTDPVDFSVPTGLPAVTNRASGALTKTITFASDVSNYINQGDRIQISGAGDQSYNGNYVVASQSSNLITYTGITPIFEGTVTETAMVVRKLQPYSDSRRSKRILLYPSLFTQNTTIHIDYIREVPPLQNDSDEPLMPIGDRTILLYGALHRAWSRERNPEEATRNKGLFDEKMKRMAGKMDDSIDQVRLIPNKIYLGSKRMAQRQKDNRNGLPEGWGGGTAGGTVITGTGNTVAIYNSTGQLASGTITVAQLQNAVTVTSSISGSIVDTTSIQTLSNKTLLDSTTAIANVIDQSKKFVWSLGSQTAGTTVTLLTLATTSRTHTLQDATDTIVERATTDTLSNKTLLDGSVNFANTSDPTKLLTHSLGGQTASTTLTLASVVTTSRTLTFPDATDTFAVLATSQTLSNKTIPMSTNTISDIANVNISSTANIAVSKLVSSTANWAATYDTLGKLTGVAPGASNNLLTSNGTNWISQAPATTALLSKTGNYTVAAADQAVILDNISSSAFSFLLPTAVGVSGKQYYFENSSTGTATLAFNTTLSQRIGARPSGSVVLQPMWDSMTIVSDGANWRILGKKETSYISSSSLGIGLSTIGNGSFGQLTGNSINLGIGQWRVSGYFLMYGGNADVAISMNTPSGFYSQNGDNTATVPTALKGAVGVTSFINEQQAGVFFGAAGTVFTNLILGTPTLSFTLNNSSAQSVYLVPNVAFTTASSADITCQLWAERIF